MNDKICFVVMPFGDENKDPEGHQLWTELYEHIKGVVERAGLMCVRADKISRPGNIIKDIIRHLATADIVVAEMTGRNANVFYELGVRHALSNSTILLAQKDEDIPFDLRPYRAIIYRFTPRGAEQLATRLEAFIEQVLKDPALPDSPVQEYLAERGDSSGSSALNLHQITAVELEREIEKVKRQNFELVAVLKELRDTTTGSPTGQPRVMPSDMVGTWTETEFRSHAETYLAVINGVIVLAYEGTWPGCCWGTLQDHIFRFSWSRFSGGLSGNGYYRLNDKLTELRGGIWFDDRSVDLMLESETILERHAMMKKSVKIDDQGSRVLDKAKRFLTSKRILRGA